MIRFLQPELHQRFMERRLLCQQVEAFHRSALTAINRKDKASDIWKITLGDNLLFDLAGLQAISKAIHAYAGKASLLEFRLKLSCEAIRDYYSHSQYLDQDGLVSLPVRAEKNDHSNNQIETLIVSMRELKTLISYPASLTEPDSNSTPLGLLMPFGCEHDFLFANQIAIFSNLNRRVRRSGAAWFRALFSRWDLGLRKRIVLLWRSIDRTAEIHPTAVVEGSVIGKGCRIGAHCVVRYSVLGENVQLHDGAKVEYSVIDDRTWLMHDLVLYRSLTEIDVFLIHGPYQFSYFQKQSAAFACVMMDYRPDAKSIQILTEEGLRQYGGRFLGALLNEQAKVLGGTLTIPGITIPAGKQITAPIDNITRAQDVLT